VRASTHAVRQITEHAAAETDEPFFQYVAYTAPHWPLHAHEVDIEKYHGVFDEGWDALREKRMQRMVDMGILCEGWALSGRDPRVEPWNEEVHKEWQVRRMEVYAAQIDRMDQGIGRILQALKNTGEWENTLIVFLSDNGGCAEEITEWTKEWIAGGTDRPGTLTTRDGRDVRFGNNPEIIPGQEDTYASYGVPWANVSNTPFRLYKHWVHEGGIATPFIAHWPAGIGARGELRHQPAQLPDVMATFLDVAGAQYPETFEGRAITPLEGFSMTPTFLDRHHTRDGLYWEHEGNRAVRKGKWKLVCKFPGKWELFNMERDRTELCDISGERPDIVRELSELYMQWAERCSVTPWEDIQKLRKK
jgi:arylsulfatase A-like enzyme